MIDIRYIAAAFLVLVWFVVGLHMRPAWFRVLSAAVVVAAAIWFGWRG